MKKTFLRFVSTALAVFMLFGCMNLGVFAADIADGQNNAADSAETTKVSVAIESATLANLIANELSAAEKAVLNHAAVKVAVTELFAADVDGYVTVTTVSGVMSVIAESIKTEIGTWTPVSVEAENVVYEMTNGVALVLTEAKAIKVNYSLEIADGSVADQLAKLPSALAAEAAEQKRVLDVYLGLKDKLEEAGAYLSMLPNFSFSTKEAKDMATLLYKNGVSRNKLILYNELVKYEKQGLAYYYKNSEKINEQIDLLRDAFAAFYKDAKFMEYAGGQGGGLDMIESVQANFNNPDLQLLPVNSVIDVKGDLASLIDALGAVTEATEVSALSIAGVAMVEVEAPETPVVPEETTTTTESETTESETTESETTESEITESETVETETTESEATESESTETEATESETVETEPAKPVENTKVEISLGGVEFHVSYANGKYNLLLPAPTTNNMYYDYNLGNTVVKVPAGADISIGEYDNIEDLLNDAVENLVGSGDVDEIIESVLGDLDEDATIEDIIGNLDAEAVETLTGIFNEIFNEVSRDELSMEELIRHDLLTFVDSLNQTMLDAGAFVTVNGEKLPIISFIVVEDNGAFSVVLRVVPFLPDVNYQELAMGIVFAFYGVEYENIALGNNTLFGIQGEDQVARQFYIQAIIDAFLSNDFSMKAIANMINANGDINEIALNGSVINGIGGELGGKILSTTLNVKGWMPESEDFESLATTYDATFPLYITFEDFNQNANTLQGVDKVLTKLGQYITVAGVDGEISLTFRMPAKLTAYYLAELLVLDYANINDVDSMDFEDSVNFILSLIKPFLADEDFTLETLENTIEKAGVSYDLSSFMSEETFATIRKVLNKLIGNAEFKADEENSKKVSISGNFGLNSLLDKIGGDMGELASGFIGEAFNGIGINLTITLEDVTLLQNNAVAIVIDPSVVDISKSDLSVNGLKDYAGNVVANPQNYISVLHTTSDLAATLKNAAANTIVILLKDTTLSSDVVIPNRVFINLNGYTITGNMSTNAAVRITNSNFASVGGVNGKLSGNFIITGGAYTCDVTSMLAKGYEVNNGVVENKLINITADKDGNITVALAADFLDRAKLPSIKEFLVDASLDIALNIFTMASLSIDGNDIYAINFNDLVGLIGGSKKEMAIDFAKEFYNCFNFQGMANIVNLLFAQFTDFTNLAESVKNDAPFASYEITTGSWHITTGVAGEEEKYVTVGLVSKNEKTRTLNFVLDFDAPAEKQTIVNLLEALAAIADIDASIDLSTLSGSVVATLDFSKDGRYGVIMAAAVAYARSEHRTELVEAIKVAMATDDYKALEAALNKVSVGDFIDALKALGSTEFEDMMNALGLSEVEYFASLESVYEYVLNIAGRLVSRLGISGGYSKVLGAINTKNANEARYVFDREYVNGHINIDLTMVLFNENTTFAPAESEIPEISVESESIYGFAIVERDGLKIFVLDAVCGGITVDELKAAMNVEIEVLGKNGADLVATKDIVKIVENGEEYNVAITGDTSCDGLVNADDATAWANTFVGVLEGDVVIEVAADVFFDGQSNGADLARLIQKYAQAANYGSNVQ